MMGLLFFLIGVIGFQERWKNQSVAGYHQDSRLNMRSSNRWISFHKVRRFSNPGSFLKQFGFGWFWVVLGSHNCGELIRFEHGGSKAYFNLPANSDLFFQVITFPLRVVVSTFNLSNICRDIFQDVEVISSQVRIRMEHSKNIEPDQIDICWIL
jgi:hypothetical protein